MFAPPSPAPPPLPWLVAGLTLVALLASIPPGFSSASKMVTPYPHSARFNAAANPAGPDPMTATRLSGIVRLFWTQINADAR